MLLFLGRLVTGLGISHCSGGMWASQSELKMQVKLNLSSYIIVQPFCRTGVLKPYTAPWMVAYWDKNR